MRALSSFGSPSLTHLNALRQKESDEIGDNRSCATRRPKTGAFDLAICDVQMPNVDGLTLLRRIRREAPRTAVVIMTSFGRIPDVVDCLRDGAIDYVTKPFDPETFTRAVVAPIAERRAIRKKVEQARARLAARTTGAALIAASRPTRSLVDRMASLANSDASVLIVGERGSGKERVARAMHAQSARRDGPLVLLDGPTLPEAIAACGHREVEGDGPSRDAWFEQAMGGTLVLDGIESFRSSRKRGCSAPSIRRAGGRDAAATGSHTASG